MRNFYKIIIIVLIITFFLISMTTQRSTMNIDDLAYALAIGIDEGENNNLKITFQFSKPSSDNDSKSSSPSSFIYTVESSSIISGTNLMNSYVSKEINLAHCKVIVFSEKVAEKGILEKIFTLVNDIQVRPDTSIVVSKCDARDFIYYSKPDLESSVSEYYEITPESSSYTGFTDYMTIGEFYNCLCSDRQEPYTILGGVNTGENTTKKNNSLTSETNTSMKAGETSFDEESSSESIGIAVFKGDKLVGELNAIESVAHLIVTNNFESTTISIPNPDNPTNLIDVYVYGLKTPKIDLKIINGSPYIKLKCNVLARVVSIDKISDNSNSDNFINSLSENVSKYLEEHVSDYLYKTSKEYSSDICGLGNYAVRNFPNMKQWNNYNWLENYQNAFFNVSFETNVKSGLLLKEN